ncbi:C-type mannose receptor 2-like [Acipenser ruthenus]|uniref:C-type mannose receptor 2-like n=1 Tax=Acipenser ruthenus TaxID=7906 RepID=UPI0027427DF9|nr:C-type mannose receptor 2-like [Acipenser ruthenus]
MSKSGGWLGYDCNSLFPFFCCEGGSSGQCFYEGAGKTWQEAQSYCRNQGRDLPSIYDQARVNELIGLVSSTNDTAYWIGLYHDKENGQWSSGDGDIYSNWEPHLLCASVNAEGEWEDSICDQRKYFMCYSEASDITERYTLIEELKTWTEAQQYCRENHTDLVSIKSASEHEDLVKKAQGTPFWIGLFNETWKWPHQGDNYTFYSWSKGEPNNDGGNQNCVMMSKTGEWTDTGCNDLNSFFCCEGGSSGQCFYEGTKKTWQEAQSYCRNQGRDLPSIYDQARVNELIGLISSTNDTAYWIGLYHDKENWQWSSGGDVIYSNWGRHLFCASVNAEGEWEDSICDQRKYFMCYSEASDITERYTLIEELKTWTEAQQYCREYHTDLVSIKNASENEEIVKKAQGTPFWIGLFNEPWKWSHRGHNYTFHNWSNGEPNSGGDNVKCVTMSKSGGWNDYGCSYLLPFFCSNQTWRPSSTPVSHESSSPSSTPVSQKSSSPSSTPVSQNSNPTSPPSTLVSQSTPVPEELHLISHSMVWPEAWQYCKDHYTDLVSLTSLAAQNRVSELVRNSTASRFWIGLHRTVVYANWYWVAGKDKRSPLNYTDWAPGEPNNPYFEHCGEMVLREDGGAEWNDLCCYEKLPFVCFKD